MQTRDKIISMGTAQFVAAALAVVYSVVVARGLGPAMRGEFFLVQAYLTVASMLAGLSTSTIMTVQLSRGQYSLPQVNSAAIVQSGVLGVGGGLATLLIFLNTTHRSGLSLAVLAVFFFSLPGLLYKNCWSAIFLGLGRIGDLAIYTVADGLLSVAGAVIAIYALHAGLDGLLIMVASETAVIAVAGQIMAVSASGVWWASYQSCLVDLFRQGWKQHLATTATQLHLRADAFILAPFLSPAALGQYAVARGISERVLLAFTPISQVMFPLISTDDSERACHYAHLAFRQIAGLGVVVVVLAIALLPVLIHLLYGAAYRDSIIPSQVLTCAFVVLGITVPVNLWFVGSLRRPELNAATSIATLILIAVLGYMLAVRWAGLGMALATLFSFVLALVFSVWLANRHGLGLRRFTPSLAEVETAMQSEISRIRTVLS